MPPVPKVTTYRYIGWHAQILEGGQPLAPGEYVTLNDSQKVGINKMLIDDGDLIDATGVNTEGGEAE